MKFIIILFFLPSIVFAKAPSCKLMTEQKSTRYRVSNLEECLSIANDLLGTREIYIQRVGSPYGGYDDIELSHIIYTVKYIYREPGLKTVGKLNI
jgi:hypothetical protein